MGRSANGVHFWKKSKASVSLSGPEEEISRSFKAEDSRETKSYDVILIQAESTEMQCKRSNEAAGMASGQRGTKLVTDLAKLFVNTQSPQNVTVKSQQTKRRSSEENVLYSRNKQTVTPISECKKQDTKKDDVSKGSQQPRAGTSKQHVVSEQRKGETSKQHVTSQETKGETSKQHVASQQTKGETSKQHVASQETKGETSKQHVASQQTKGETSKQHVASQQTKEEISKQHVASQQTKEETSKQHVTSQQTKGETSKQHVTSQETKGDTNKQHVTSQQTKGETSKQHVASQQTKGETSKQHVTSQQTKGETSKPHVASQQTKGETSKQHVASQPTKGETSNKHVASQEPKGEINKQSVSSQQTNQDARSHTQQITSDINKSKQSKSKMQKQNGNIDKSESASSSSGNTDIGPSGVALSQDVLKQISRTLEKEQLLGAVKPVLFTIISRKDHTHFDFKKILSKFKAALINPIEIKVNGMTILHECVDKGRLSFLPVLVHYGWIALLAKCKVDESSDSEFRGKTAEEIANAKRTRKPIAEVQRVLEWERSLSRLMKACRSGDTSKALHEIESGGEQIYFTDSNGGNALYWAVVAGNEKLFEKMIASGMDPGKRTVANENLLHVAVMTGNAKMIPVLMKASLRLDTGLRDHGNKTPLDRAAENGDIDCVSTFVACGVQPGPENVVLSAFCGRLPYMVHLMERLGLPTDAVDEYDRTSLHRAVEGGRVDIVKYLLGRTAGVTLHTSSRRNLLHIACDCGNTDIFDIIVTKMQEVPGQLESMLSVQDRYTGVELCFLIRGQDRGRDAWHYVEVRRHQVPGFLIKTRAGNVDVQDYGRVIDSGWGVNPVQEAVEEREGDFHRRRLNTAAPADMTPLHIALYKGHVELALKLLSLGCHVNTKDCQGNTPVMLAASRGQLEVIKGLEKRGADFYLRNTAGKTAADIAQQNDQVETVTYINTREMHLKARSFDGKIAELKKQLSAGNLSEVRMQRDVKTHIIDTLRDFDINMNEFLCDIGSGPVLEATGS